jgi:hypothetical protein
MLHLKGLDLQVAFGSSQPLRFSPAQRRGLSQGRAVKQVEGGVGGDGLRLAGRALRVAGSR